jgi:molecular chaperone GrpE
MTKDQQEHRTNSSTVETDSGAADEAMAAGGVQDQSADPATGIDAEQAPGQPSASADWSEGEPGEGEPSDGLEPNAGPDSDPSNLTMLLEDARARADDAHNQVLRVRAEMENMSRRQAKELENAHKFALEGFVKELLQVRDSLELGQAAAAAEDADLAKLQEGTELTLKLLRDVMAKFGIERIDPQGETFNPDYHQAMSMQPRDDVPPNTVVAVVQSGYLLNGRLMRPALVMVSRAA